MQTEGNLKHAPWCLAITQVGEEINVYLIAIVAMDYHV